MYKENLKNMHAFKNFAKICKYMQIYANICTFKPKPLKAYATIRIEF